MLSLFFFLSLPYQFFLSLFFSFSSFTIAAVGHADIDIPEVTFCQKKTKHDINSETKIEMKDLFRKITCKGRRIKSLTLLCPFKPLSWDMASYRIFLKYPIFMIYSVFICEVQPSQKVQDTFQYPPCRELLSVRASHFSCAQLFSHFRFRFAVFTKTDEFRISDKTTCLFVFVFHQRIQ